MTVVSMNVRMLLRQPLAPPPHPSIELESKHSSDTQSEPVVLQDAGSRKEVCGRPQELSVDCQQVRGD